MDYEEVLKTTLQRGNPNLLKENRIRRIEEAINWEGNTLENPNKIIVASINENIDAYFLKPGKETANGRNPYDMTPRVGDTGNNWRFDEIWALLSKIAIKDFEMFRMVLTLIYRNAYLLDHIDINGSIRYQPCEEIAQCIDEIDTEIDGILPYNLMGLLHFLDMLGWNEDVKYHTENNTPTFEGKYKFNVGRINTLLSCIRVPYQTSSFVRHIIDNSEDVENINTLQAYETMQQLAKSRGTCTPTQTQLVEWLSPYIVR